MLKSVFLSVLISFFALYSYAAGPLSNDSLVYNLKLKDHNLKEKKLVSYIKNYFGGIPVDSFTTAKQRLHKDFVKYELENSAAYEFYIESIFHNRLLRTDEAKDDLLKAIDMAVKVPDHYLLYTFFSNLAFIQTYEGNAIEAVSSFRTAKKEAIILNDAFLQVIVDINISDIYYRYNFHSQSLYYLRQARLTMATGQLNQPRLENIMTYNICENYFRMGQLDSLKKYNAMLRASKTKTYKLYTYVKRTDYYIDLLSHNYRAAINLITSLPNDGLYKYENLDKQNLADAYFNANMPDSAAVIIQQLLVDKAQTNHPEIKYHLYEILGEIAQNKGDVKNAAYNFNMALQQSKDNVSKLIQVGDISSRIKVDDMESIYMQQDEIYKRERLWLLFIIVVALLIIAVVTMFYRNAWQKRHYERLLFIAKKQELSFINSHEIRRHLSNILGLIETLKKSDNKHEDYQESEDHLLYSAEKLDEAIKNISEKLEEDGG
jgi:hypothetical protein